jgi:hypothetical protein
VTVLDQSAHRLDTPKGVAEVVLTDGQNVTLHAAFPSPPGSPLSGVLQGTQLTLRVKVHGCRRIAADAQSCNRCGAAPSNEFEITGRWVNLSREAKLALLAPIQAP